MSWTNTKTVTLVGTVILAIGSIVLWTRNSTAQETRQRAEQQQQAKLAAAIPRINEANAALPAPQTQVKTLIFAAMIQKKIPLAANWCDTLNAGNKLWPVTPTNTSFALNRQMAGRIYQKGIPGDAVVFFETENPGWNQAGGPELLAQKGAGVAVALMDGRALMVSTAEAAKLRWTP